MTSNQFDMALIARKDKKTELKYAETRFGELEFGQVGIFTHSATGGTQIIPERLQPVVIPVVRSLLADHITKLKSELAEINISLGIDAD